MKINKDVTANLCSYTKYIGQEILLVVRMHFFYLLLYRGRSVVKLYKSALPKLCRTENQITIPHSNAISHSLYIRRANFTSHLYLRCAKQRIGSQNPSQTGSLTASILDE